MVIADTAAAVMSEYKKGGPWAAAAAALQGAVQFAAVSSASKGGGSTTAAVPAESLPQEAPELEAQNTDLNNSNQTITIKFDESTELGGALNNAINQAKQDGAI